MNTLIVCLLLITFVGFIFYIFKGGNLMLGFFIMALLWTVIGGISYQKAILDVFATPVAGYGSTIVYIIFGSCFGQVLVDSGIAPAISHQTGKLGKKSPLLTAILVVLVTALIFSSAYGVGSVIAIGVILLPILLSVGIPRPIALTAFSLAVGAPMYINVVLYNQMKAFFPKAVYGGKYLIFGICAALVQLLAVIIFLAIHAHKFDPKQAQKNLTEIEATNQDKEVPKVPVISYIIPVVPVAMNIIFKWDAIPSLVLASILAMLLTGKMSGYKKMMSFINETIQKGISNIAGLIMFLLILMMFSGAASLNAKRFEPIFKAILPHSTLAICILIGIIAPLSLFRGPLQVWGAGAATAAVLSGMHLFPDSFLLPLLYTATLFAVSTDITQSWNVWGLGYMKVQSKELLKYGIPVMWIVSIINEFLVYVFLGR
ncbi:gluconate:proton symporter [Oenococcus sp. UCMA 16435]|nr:gluconate:proton symporter [Oenococcus sp. UCMA 16435]MDI4584384.1 gluconate:proton symporter [Oenococcus sp. UCMA 14587]